MSLVPRYGWQLLLGALVSMTGMADLSLAQRDDIVVEDSAGVQANPGVQRRFDAAEAVRLRQLVVQRGGLEVSQQAIDQWVFGGRSGAQIKTQLESLLRERVDELLVLCDGSDDQKKRLELAGWVDIRRFHERVDDLKRQAPAAKNNPDRIKEIQQQALRLNVSIRVELFDDGSFFAKSVRSAFTSEQLLRAERERMGSQHRVHVTRAAALVKDAVKLTDRQEEELIALLLAETRPPRQPGVNPYTVALFDMKRLPESKLKPLFNDQQWDLFNRQFEQVKWMEPYLKQNGFLHEEPAASGPMK